MPFSMRLIHYFVNGNNSVDISVEINQKLIYPEQCIQEQNCIINHKIKFVFQFLFLTNSGLHL